MKASNGGDVLIKDHEALKSVALDYLEGWFEGDAERMERALHPKLVKRSLDRLPDGSQFLGGRGDTADQMIRWTADGIGKKRDVPDRAIDIGVGHVYGDIATVTVTSAVYVEYLHLVRMKSGWKIANVLWAWASENGGDNG